MDNVKRVVEFSGFQRLVVLTIFFFYVLGDWKREEVNRCFAIRKSQNPIPYNNVTSLLHSNLGSNTKSPIAIIGWERIPNLSSRSQWLNQFFFDFDKHFAPVVHITIQVAVSAVQQVLLPVLAQVATLEWGILVRALALFLLSIFCGMCHRSKSL